MNQFKHSPKWDANNPVSIYKADTTGITREIKGALKVIGKVINVGDTIESTYIGRFTQGIVNWKVVEIKERFTPKGNWIIDPTNIGFIAIVEPAN